MTLSYSSDAPAASSSATPQYLIFFSSGSPPWCPDCVDAQPAVQKVFGADSGLDGHIVLVGERPEWKSAENKFRKEYAINCIPTITKVVNVSHVLDTTRQTQAHQ